MFRSTRDGPGNLYQKVITGATPEEPLIKSAYDKTPLDWSRDGRYIMYNQTNPKDSIWVLPLFGDRKPFPYLQTEFNERDRKLVC